MAGTGRVHSFRLAAGTVASPRQRAKKSARPDSQARPTLPTGPAAPQSPDDPAAAKSSAFELAILGSLADNPMHGYELRQKLSTTLGSLRVFSYGSLYPMLRRLESVGAITSLTEIPDPDAIPITSRRSRVVYQLTGDGKERLVQLLAEAGPRSSSDEGFEVHLAFFARTTADARVRILEGRMRRLEERQEGLRAALSKAADRMDEYTNQLRLLGLESADREVRWLSELIDRERSMPENLLQPSAKDVTPQPPL